MRQVLEVPVRRVVVEPQDDVVRRGAASPPRQVRPNLIDCCLISMTSSTRCSGMLAVTLDDFRIIVVDMETREVARVFQGHTSRVTDSCFRADGRWLVTAAMDGSVRTWDLPSGRCVIISCPPSCK